MQTLKDGYFFNPTKGHLSAKDVLSAMVEYMREKPEKFYDIIVGCDSPSSDEPHFPVAVVILRVGEGGKFFLKKVTYPPSYNKRFLHWRGRILQEVLLSCELALFMRENFQQKMKELAKENFNYQFRYIHADVGENGQTQEMVREVIGLIRGNGFEPKIKPESYAATCVADRYT